MIKRRIFLLVLILSLGLSTMSGTVRQVPDEGKIIPVKFKPKRTIDDNTGHPFPHSIVKCPSVGVCGRTLYLYDGCANATLVLVDEKGDKVYVCSVSDGTETLELEDNIKGIYQLLIIRGDFGFEAEVEF